MPSKPANKSQCPKKDQQLGEKALSPSVSLAKKRLSFWGFFVLFVGIAWASRLLCFSFKVTNAGAALQELAADVPGSWGHRLADSGGWGASGSDSWNGVTQTPLQLVGQIPARDCTGKESLLTLRIRALTTAPPPTAIFNGDCRLRSFHRFRSVLEKLRAL